MDGYARRWLAGRMFRLLPWLLCATLLHAGACGDSEPAGPDAGDTGTDAGDSLTPDSGASASADAAVPMVPPEDGSPFTFSAVLRVLDESDAPVAGATVDTGSQVLTTSALGEVVLANRNDPVVAVIEGPGLLAEPVVIGHASDGQTIEVRVRGDAGGARWTMHVAGDVMLARRYHEPQGNDPPLIDPDGDIAAGARHVVAPVARAFAAADIGTVNLETVVSKLPDSSAYPQKRIVINSHPDTMAALPEMGVDVVMLGNNHLRDFMDEGVQATMDALDAIGIDYVGAAASGAEPANAPYIFTMGNTRVGILSYTTLSGDPNNDRLAVDGDPVPGDLAPEDAWEYEARPWSFDGEVLDVPQAERRAGSAWGLFRDAEPAMSEAEAAAAWSSLYAVYPELQDGVARRGHGGPAYWTTSGATADIAALAEEVDLVMVQIHGGFEFAQVPSPVTVRITRAAVDAGADIVVAHHPHVLQGFEWYKGRLIAYSMGNFLFDQEEHALTPSGFLRLVWEGDELVEARIVPLDLGNYRPNPLADGASLRHVLALWERSILGAVVERDDTGEARVFLTERDADTRLGHLRMRHDDAIITDTAPAAETLRVEVPAGAIVCLDYPGLVHARAGGADVLLGRELFGWGNLEDHAADDASTHAMHWRIIHSDASLEVDDSAGSGFGYLTMYRKDTYESDASAFTAARIPIPAHRWFHDQDGTGVPADGAATYTARLLARMSGAGEPYLRLDLYPTEGVRPDAGKLGELELPFAVPDDGQWHPIDIEVPADGLVVGGERMEGVRANIRLRPPATGEALFALDHLRIIEWRPAAAMPDRFGAYTHIRNPGAEDVTVELQVMPVRDP